MSEGRDLKPNELGRKKKSQDGQWMKCVKRAELEAQAPMNATKLRRYASSLIPPIFS